MGFRNEIARVQEAGNRGTADKSVQIPRVHGDVRCEINACEQVFLELRLTAGEYLKSEPAGEDLSRTSQKGEVSQIPTC